jgi:Ni/Co efflux regulator RcnB
VAALRIVGARRKARVALPPDTHHSTEAQPMRTRSVSNMLLGAALLSAVALSAQAKPPHDRGHGHDRGDRHGQDRGHDAPRYAGMHDRGRHEGWYKKGGYLPRDYRDDRYVVVDWRRDRLRQPPRGYHWVRSDNGDFLLVAIASGLIADLLLHH